MKSLFLFLLLSVTVASGAITAGDPAGEIAWRTDYEAALTEAKEAGQPLLLDFTATWCGPCRMMEATTFADPAIRQLLKKYVTVRIDLDQNPALAGKYHVQAIPNLVLLNRFAEVVETSTGYLDAGKLTLWLKSHEAAASVAVSRAQLAQQKMATFDAALHSPDAAVREGGLTQLLDSYAAQDDTSTAAGLILKGIAADHPSDLLTHLDDARLTIRIMVTNLLSQQLGAEFSCDPWEAPETRAATIQTWQKKLAPKVQ